MPQDRLTAAQQDYLEVVYRLGDRDQQTPVRVTAIAQELGTRLPTVTRMVAKLAAMGLLEHQLHGDVSLSEPGRLLAAELVHLHDDILYFLTDVLGLDQTVAAEDVCRLEHGFSRQSAQRFHQFLAGFERLTDEQQARIRSLASTQADTSRDFKRLDRATGDGWRS